MRIAVFLCLILCMANNIFAAPVSSGIVSPLVLTGERHNNYNLAAHMEMYIDKSHQLTLKDVTDPSFSSKFVPYDFAEQRSGKNYDQTVWLRFRIKNTTADDIHLFLTKNFPNQYTDWVVYKQTPQGAIRISSFADKTIHISLFPLDIPEKSTETYYLHNYSEGWLQTTFHLMKPGFYLLDQMDLFFVMGIQYGIALALVLHSLFIYLFLRDRSYLLYIAFVLSALLAYVLMDGLLNRLPGLVITNWLYLHFYRFVMVQTGFIYILFAKNILQTKKYTPRTNFVMNIMLWLAVPSAVMAWLPSFGHAVLSFAAVLTITYYINISLVLSAIAAILVAFKGYKPAQYYLAGMIAIVVACLFYLATYFRAILPTALIFRLPQLGVDIDMILQAIALAVRFNLIQEEQIKTQHEVIKQKDLNAKLQERALRDKQRLIKAYARFFPRRFLELLKKKSILDIHLGDQTEKNMTVLFADLRNFTTLLEKKSPSESFAFINGYLNQVAPIVRQHDGLIDKYIGDAILALYEGPAEGAVHTAIDIIKLLHRINQSSVDKIEMGIGIHYGSLMVGTIGEQERMDSTVISDTVNASSRLENLNKIYGTHVIISGQTIDTFTKRDEFKIRYLDHIRVKGKSQSIKLYEVFDGDPSELVEGKLKAQPIYQTAVQYFQEQEFAKALDAFERCLEIIPTDKTFLLYVDRCRAFVSKGHIRDWHAIVKLSDKVELTY